MNKMRKVFDKTAGSYDEWYGTLKGIQVYRAEREAVDNLLPKEGIGVEVGAGTGIFAEALIKQNRSVICLDLSGEMLKKSTERGLTSILSDANHIPFRNKILDFIYMITVIEFLDNPIQTLKELRYAMKTNSPLITITISKDSLWGKHYQKMAEQGATIMRHANFYKPIEIKEIFVKSGWKLDAFFGTLTTGPEDEKPGDQYVPIKSNPGIIITRSYPKKGSEA